MIDNLMAAAVISGGFSLTFLAITAGLFFIGEIRERQALNKIQTPTAKGQR